MKLELELKHLAPYLPYGLKCQYQRYIDDKIITTDFTISDVSYLIEKSNFKLILRPMNEIEIYIDLLSIGGQGIASRMTNLNCYLSYDDVCVLLKNHFDVFDLIPAGLAISYKEAGL